MSRDSIDARNQGFNVLVPSRREPDLRARNAPVTFLLEFLVKVARVNLIRVDDTHAVFNINHESYEAYIQ